MFGFDPRQWDRARAQVCEVLVAQARLGEYISYSELVSRISAIHLDLDTEKDRASLGRLLGDVSEKTHAQSIGMLSAMAVLKEAGSPLSPGPGSGFYELAKTLGYRFTDRRLFWAEQFQRVTTHYGERR